MPRSGSDMDMSGRLDKYLDIVRSPGCSVKYRDNHHDKEWRPSWNKFEDRSALNRADIHRQRAEEASQRRKDQSFSEKARSTWSNSGDTGFFEATGSQVHDAIIGPVPRFNMPQLGRSAAITRSLSDPSLRAKPFFHLQHHPESPHDSVLRAREAAGRTAHMPGYKGFVPGLTSETHSIACRFATATQRTLDAKRADRTGLLGGFERKSWGVRPFSVQ